MIDARGMGTDTSVKGPKCVNGDIVEMTLDLDDLTLKYKVNDKDSGFLCNVEKAEYRMAFFTSWRKTKIELL